MRRAEPASALAEKAVVVGGRDTGGTPPAKIDDYVKAQLAAGADLYTLHADALAGLAPDLILTQTPSQVWADLHIGGFPQAGPPNRC